LINRIICWNYCNIANVVLAQVESGLPRCARNDDAGSLMDKLEIRYCNDDVEKCGEIGFQTPRAVIAVKVHNFGDGFSVIKNIKTELKLR
jgi:hypothetical protein